MDESETHRCRRRDSMLTGPARIVFRSRIIAWGDKNMQIVVPLSNFVFIFSDKII